MNVKSDIAAFKGNVKTAVQMWSNDLVDELLASPVRRRNVKRFIGNSCRFFKDLQTFSCFHCYVFKEMHFFSSRSFNEFREAILPPFFTFDMLYNIHATSFAFALGYLMRGTFHQCVKV